MTNEWRQLFVDVIKNISTVGHTQDYGNVLSAHLQFISGLCQQSIIQTDTAIQSFISNSFITGNLLLETTFHTRIFDVIAQARLDAPDAFVRVFEIARAIYHSNAYISAYTTNYIYVPQSNTTSMYSTIFTRSLVYQGTQNCTCGVDGTCTATAAFTSPNYTEVKGLKIGCTPSESLLASTLECFYDADCIDTILSRMTNRVSRCITQLRKTFFIIRFMQLQQTVFL